MLRDCSQFLRHRRLAEHANPRALYLLFKENRSH
jgi:hypothetical protein